MSEHWYALASAKGKIHKLLEQAGPIKSIFSFSEAVAFPCSPRLLFKRICVKREDTRGHATLKNSRLKMSWNGFVKAVNRATTTVMQSTGAIEKTVDKDFEDEEKRFRNFEAKVEALHKESKGFLDSVRAMTLAQARIAETVDQFYDESASLAVAGRKYKDVVLLMDSNTRTQLDNNYRVAIIEPLGKLIGVFPDFSEAIKKRQKKLLDYDRLRANVRKLVDKPSDDPQKLPKVRV